MRRHSVLVAAALAIGAAPQAADAPPPTLAELQDLPDDCPLIYDNDWLRDVVDDDYVFLQAHLGRANLRGVVLTKDLWENGTFYSLQQARTDFDGEYAILRRMGLRNIPDYVVGADRPLVRPSSGRIEDAAPVASAGVSLIVEEARKAAPGKPLVVFVGGPINSVASAYLTDPSIADRMVVVMTDLTGYNGKDPWARPESWKAVVKCRVTGVFTFQDGTSDPYDFLDCSSADMNLMADEFFAVVEAAYGAGDSPPALRDPENPAGAVNGLDYAFYEGSWSTLPDFGALAPARTGTAATFDLSPRTRDDFFGFRFAGYVRGPADGTYTFFTSSDDGSRLWIDGVLVVDNDGLHGMQERRGGAALSADPHAIRVEFFEREGGEGLEVRWEGPGVGRQGIPASLLSAASAPPGGGDGGEILAEAGGEGEEGCGLVGLEAAVLAALVLRLGARRRR